ncbi:MAG: GxxExxY protein [Chitinophagaceae bacterium]|nr:GxxExxY protein [Chitinophagaceae bacterium]
MHTPLSVRENELGYQMVDIAFAIHRFLGPGLLESVYEKCFCYELHKRQIPFIRQKPVPIQYETLLVEEGLRLDLLIDYLIIIELKAQENYHPVWEAQLLSYLKLTGKRIGYLINFHVPLMKDGYKRLVL